MPIHKLLEILKKETCPCVFTVENHLIHTESYIKRLSCLIYHSQHRYVYPTYPHMFLSLSLIALYFELKNELKFYKLDARL